MKPIEVYKLYYNIKLHFTADYDFFKYNNKSKINYVKKYENDKSKSFFITLSKAKPKLILAIIIIGLVYKNQTHISDIVNEQNIILGKKLISKWESLVYTIGEDLKTIRNYSIEELYNKCIDDSIYPILIDKLLSNELHIETVCAFNHIMPISKIECTDFILWPTIKNKIEKYTPFLNLSVKHDNIIDIFIDNGFNVLL